MNRHFASVLALALSGCSLHNGWEMQEPSSPFAKRVDNIRTEVGEPEWESVAPVVKYSPSGAWMAEKSFPTLYVSESGHVWIEDYAETRRGYAQKFYRVPLSKKKARAFYAYLEAIKPNQDQHFSGPYAVVDDNGKYQDFEGDCDIYMTHFAGLYLQWTDADGSQRVMDLDFGCDPEVHYELRQYLDMAPTILGYSEDDLPFDSSPPSFSVTTAEQRKSRQP